MLQHWRDADMDTRTMDEERSTQTDCHHSALLRTANGEAHPTSSASPLARYLNRVQELQQADSRIFEKVEIEINLGCNRRCTYCFLATDQRENYVKARRKVMEWSLYHRLLEQLQELQFEGVLCFHFYGEPLLNKRLADYVAHAKRMLPRAQSILYTNGDLLSLPQHRKLTDAGVDVFFVTRHDNRIPEPLEPVLKQQNVLLDTRKSMTLNNRAGYLGTAGDTRVSTLPCIYTSESIIVTIDGEVLPCACDFRQTQSFGNIQSAHIGAIYRSEACVQFRRDLLDGKRAKYQLCESCDVYCEVLGSQSAAESHRRVEQPTVKETHRQSNGHGSSSLDR